MSECLKLGEARARKESRTQQTENQQTVANCNRCRTTEETFGRMHFLGAALPRQNVLTSITDPTGTYLTGCSLEEEC
jgi:hypothetical protein